MSVRPVPAEALIDAGIARVVVAMEDPNPLVAGRGLARLRDANIDVAVGPIQEDVASQSRLYYTDDVWPTLCLVEVGCDS